MNGARKPRKPPFVRAERIVHQDDGEGNWLISYADMMTLLAGLFVILFATAKVEQKRREQVLEKELHRAAERPVTPLVPQTPLQQIPPTKQMLDRGLTNSLKNVIQDAKLTREIIVTEATDGTTLVIRGRLFFDSGSVDLKPGAKILLERLAGVLIAAAKDHQVVIEGHTDDEAIHTDRFPSNWELSAGRAGTVVRLLESFGFPHSNLRPIGFADTAPIVPNSSESRYLNRRIVIRVSRPPEAVEEAPPSAH